MKIISFNLRYATADDGANSWPHRRELVASVIGRHAPDVLCVQEALAEQMDYLGECLPGYRFAGVGRRDGRRDGEFAAIFFKRWLECKQSGTFWLSQTPDQVGSRGWNACNIRICTWAHLVPSGSEAKRTTGDAATDPSFLVYNTHLDHIDPVARLEGTRLIKQHMATARATPESAGRPLLLAGDFNCEPGSPPYRLLTEAEPVPLRDARCASSTPALGPEWTNHNFQPPGDSIIDHIFVSSNVRVNEFIALEDNGAGRYPSDHLPIMADVTLHNAARTATG